MCKKEKRRKNNLRGTGEKEPVIFLLVNNAKGGRVGR